MSLPKASFSRWSRALSPSDLLLRAVGDKVHIPMAPREATEQERQVSLLRGSCFPRDPGSRLSRRSIHSASSV